MTVSQTLTSFASAVGEEVGALKEIVNGKAADLSALETTDKTNLVNAINELRDFVIASTSIDDASTSDDTTWSSTQIAAFIDAQLAALIGNAPDALNTLGELADAIADNPNFATDIANLANSVRYDIPQSLTDLQKGYARGNIGAASSDELGPDVDFVAVFNQGLI